MELLTTNPLDVRSTTIQPQAKRVRVSKLTEEEKLQRKEQLKEYARAYQRTKYRSGANEWKLRDLSDKTFEKAVKDHPEEAERLTAEKERLGIHFNTIYRTKKFLDRLPQELVLKELDTYITDLLKKTTI